MFQLFRRRNFANVFDDTIKFFKIYFKPYFANYFKITGILLLILLVFFWFGFSFIYDGLFNSGSTPNPNFFVTYFQNNISLFISLIVIGFILFYIMTIVTTIYPYAFLSLIEKNKELTFNNILEQYKSKLGKGILFSIFSIFTLLPVAFIILAICMGLSIILIGIPLLIICFGAFTSIFLFSFVEYLNTKNGYFNSIGNAITYFFKKPWLCIGVTLVFYIIIQIIGSCVTFIPYTIGIFDLVSGNKPTSENFTFFFIMMVITIILSFIVGFFNQNIIYITQGLLYYSNKEAEENISSQSEIDLIGKVSNEE